MKDILLISRAWHFAAQRHSAQRRKGKAQEPYVNHLAEVAELVATATEGQDTNLVAAAVLHDTVEDTGTLPAELMWAFGDNRTARSMSFVRYDTIHSLRCGKAEAKLI